MAKDREIACENYICEGECKKGKPGTFRKHCQTCDSYKPVRGGVPARKNLKKEKTEKFLNDKRNW